ncbi:arachidonate 5-lipoxygenase-like isoform X1 [Pocillopora damicornis]|uniref:arachidonate 5-lipoxygenase-like isoform X1 n=2 Tax=Pocillopora damicornis TaxID=46731 RepID=UPI000F556F08|nr:arachidonate 5-lipoxygenase-like isoform X1 [Pocillopora damicornis]
MNFLAFLVTFIWGFITSSRHASATRCEVSLPQHVNSAACMSLRKAAIAKNQEIYTYKFDPAVHGFALLNMTAQELGAVALKDPFMAYYTTAYVTMTRASNSLHQLYQNLTSELGEINQISEYLALSEFFQTGLEPIVGEYVRLPSRHEAFIRDKTEWISDKFFTQQRLAGANPMSLKKVTIHGEESAVGLDWNELKKTLNPEFDWDGAVKQATKSKYSLNKAIALGRIFALRYELCDDMPRSLDLTDRNPERKMWNFLSPIALFVSRKVGRRNQLVPVAIQMDYTPDSAVYTPKSGDNWMLAKLNVQITDLGYSQIVEHLAKVHFLIEPFCISLKRTLPPAHPLNQMLKYHCREVIVPNTFGTPALVDEFRFMDLLFAFGNDGANRLLRDAHEFSTWEVTDFRGNIKKRGLANRNLLPYFPYRDDGMRILTVIERMVERYVDLYYKDDEDVAGDEELQAYINEVSLDGTGPNGGIGRIQGLPSTIESKQALCEIVSRIISHLTIAHAAVNYQMSDYASFVPNLPTKLYNDSRVADGEFSVFRLPNRATSAIEASFVNSLATFRFDSLFDYGNELEDPKAAKLVNYYYCFLMRVLQPKMQLINQRREKYGYLTYPYLIPRWMPNGIQT